MTQTASPEPGGDYTAALSELHRLLLDYQSADSFLRKAAALTARTVGDGLSCSIMLQPGGHALTVATSDPLATVTEEIQENTGQGPSLRALRWRHLVHIDDVAEDTRWPLFARRAAEMGVRSCLCLPLQAPGVSGALSLYAPKPYAFGTSQISRATTFAHYLTAALIIGARQDGLLATIDQLRTALASRAVVDQAIGVIMTREHCTSSHARAILRTESQHRNLQPLDLARHIVTKASGRLSRPESGAHPSEGFAAARPEPAVAERTGNGRKADVPDGLSAASGDLPSGASHRRVPATQSPPP